MNAPGFSADDLDEFGMLKPKPPRREGWGRLAARRFLAKQGLQHGEVLTSLGIEGAQLSQYEELVADAEAKRKRQAEAENPSKFFRPMIPRFDTRREKEIKLRINVARSRLADLVEQRARLTADSREYRRTNDEALRLANSRAHVLIDQTARFDAAERRLGAFSEAHRRRVDAETTAVAALGDDETGRLRRMIDETVEKIKEVEGEIDQLENYTTAGYTLDCLQQELLEERLMAIGKRHDAEAADVAIIGGEYLRSLIDDRAARKRDVVESAMKEQQSLVDRPYKDMAEQNTAMERAIEEHRAESEKMRNDDIPSLELEGKSLRRALRRIVEKTANLPTAMRLEEDGKGGGESCGDINIPRDKKCAPDENLEFTFEKFTVLPY